MPGSSWPRVRVAPLPRFLHTSELRGALGATGGLENVSRMRCISALLGLLVLPAGRQRRGWRSGLRFRGRSSPRRCPFWPRSPSQGCASRSPRIGREGVEEGRDPAAMALSIRATCVLASANRRRWPAMAAAMASTAGPTRAHHPGPRPVSAPVRCHHPGQRRGRRAVTTIGFRAPRLAPPAVAPASQRPDPVPTAAPSPPPPRTYGMS
jgi:hypothetical protein